MEAPKTKQYLNNILKMLNLYNQNNLSQVVLLECIKIVSEEIKDLIDICEAFEFAEMQRKQIEAHKADLARREAEQALKNKKSWWVF